MTARRKWLLAGGLLACVTGTAIAQVSGGFDPAQLPELKGTVAEYSLTPRGDVDGLILADGTEIHLPPHLGAQLVAAVRPGDAVRVRGLEARAIPVVEAMEVTDQRSGASVVDTGAGGPPGPSGAQRQLAAQGRIKQDLHGPAGDLNGALLDDGTIVRLPPPEARRLASMLAPGTVIAVEGTGFQSDLGRVVAASLIGPNASGLVAVAQTPAHRPPPPGGS